MLSLTWFLFVVNNNYDITLGITQMMRCMECHSITQAHSSSNNTIEKKKGVVTYNKDYGTTSLKKHLIFKHANVWT
jgi:hypothetical protein